MPEKHNFSRISKFLLISYLKFWRRIKNRKELAFISEHRFILHFNNKELYC